MPKLACKAIFFDLSGVLYEGNHVIQGAPQIVEQARSAGLTVRFVTNTATHSIESILRKLCKMQIEAHPSELFSAPLATKAYIQSKQWRPYLLIHQAIEELFADLEQHDPNCVVVGDAREHLHYRSMNQAFQLCEAGAPLIAIGYNKYFSEDGALMLDGGPFVKALEWASDTQAIVMGKPGKAFFEQVVASTGHPAEACLMIGDDLDGDIIGALDAGLQACLVRTGKFKPGDLERLPAAAGVIESIGDLEQQIARPE